MSIAWPALLPIPFVDSNGGPIHPILASDLESASIVRRLRYGGTAPIAVGFRWVFGIGEYILFKSFFLTSLHNGARIFHMDLRHPKTSELISWEMRFTDDYQASYEDGNWSVTASLDLLRPTTLPDASPVVGASPFLVEPDSNPFITSDGFQLYV